ECKWNEEAQWDMFLHGLADRVQKEIYALDLPANLNGLIDLALRVDSRLSRAERRGLSARLPPGEGIPPRASGHDAISPHDEHEPMQVGRARLSREEKERRRSRGLCLYCGAPGHYAFNCPVPLSPLTDPIAVNALNGQTLPKITFVTKPVTLTVSGNHSESIPFYILDSPLAPVVLGHPWLIKHNPRIDWQLQSEKAVDVSNVPVEYLDLKEVFSKSRAASLPPHRPYDCAIELLP
ncbi:hypothetical protein M9458_035561, partial [Cirrhinus mrigala]